LLGHALGIGVDDGAQDRLALHQLVERTPGCSLKDGFLLPLLFSRNRLPSRTGW